MTDATIRLIKLAEGPGEEVSDLRRSVQQRIQDSLRTSVAALSIVLFLASTRSQLHGQRNWSLVFMCLLIISLATLRYATQYESKWFLRARRIFWMANSLMFIAFILLFTVAIGAMSKLLYSDRNWRGSIVVSFMALLMVLAIGSFIPSPLRADMAKVQVDRGRLNRNKPVAIYTVYFVPLVWLGVLALALIWIWWGHSEGLDLNIAVGLTTLIVPAMITAVWKGMQRQLRVMTAVVEAADRMIVAALEDDACLMEAGLDLERALGVGIDYGVPFWRIPVADEQICETLRKYIFTAAGDPELASHQAGNGSGVRGIGLSIEDIREHLVEFSGYVRYLFARYVDVRG